MSTELEYPIVAIAHGPSGVGSSFSLAKAWPPRRLNHFSRSHLLHGISKLKNFARDASPGNQHQMRHKRWWLVLRLSLCWVAATIILIGITPPVSAQSLNGQSSTYLRGFVRPADREVAHYLPFYESVSLQGRDLGLAGLSVHTSLWGLIDFADVQERYRATGDVSLLYLQYRAPDQGRLRFLRGLELIGGRQFVALGPSVLEQVDGGKIYYRHSSGMEVGFFGGAPTGTRFAFQPWPMDEDRYNYGYNWLLGGRLGYMLLGKVGGGVSLVHRRYRGRIADHDLGADINYRPFTWLDLKGAGVASLEGLRAKEITATTSLILPHSVVLDLGYRYSSPDLWLSRTSIFAVFSQETLQEATLTARWRATRALSLEGGYGRNFNTAAGREGEGIVGENRVNARGVLRFGEQLMGRAVVEAERLEAIDNAANRVRLAWALPFNWRQRVLRLIVDADFLILDEAIRGSEFSFLGAGYLEIPLKSEVSILVGGSGGVTPLLSQEGSFLVRLTWNFAAPSPRAAVQVERGRLMP